MMIDKTSKRKMLYQKKIYKKCHKYIKILET